MAHHYHPPQPSISKYVRTILVLNTEEADESLPLFTNGMPALVCRFRHVDGGLNELQHLKLYGKGAPSEFFSVGDRETIVAYFFMPFTLPATFAVATAVLAGDSLDLRLWNAHKTNALSTQLSYAPSTVAVLAVLDQFIEHQLNLNRRECEIVRVATDTIMLDSSPDVLARLPGNLRVSERSLQRIFKKYVGISPVHYRRICQFQDSLTQLRTGKFGKLTDVAFDRGFADQSHFIRSFREFTDTTPDSYLKSGLNTKKV